MEAEKQSRNLEKSIKEMTMEERLRVGKQQKCAVFLECISIIVLLYIGGFLVTRSQYCVLDYLIYIFYAVTCVVIMGVLFRRESQVYSLLKEERPAVD